MTHLLVWPVLTFAGMMLGFAVVMVSLSIGDARRS